jgi:hypothetical protein
MFAKANMSGPFGKLALGSALGVIDDQTLRFARALGEIRNAFAHNIANAGLRLKDYLATFDEQQCRAKRDALDMVCERDEIIDAENKISAFDLFCSVPKSIIGGSLGVVLIDIHDRTSVAKGSQDMRRNADKLYRDFYLLGVAGDRVSDTLGSLAQLKKPDADSPKEK